MAARNTTTPRPVRIPIGAESWWPRQAMAAAEARAAKLGIRSPGIRSLTEELARAGVQTDEDTVGRNLRGDIVTWEVAVPLSRILEIPPPAVIPENDDEAQMIADILDRVRKIRR